MNPPTCETHDAIIVGGGPAGTSTAIRLAMRGARVLLVEQKTFPRPKLCGEFISPECLTHFARLGVMDQMSAAGGKEVTETVFYARGGSRVVMPSEWLPGRSHTALGLSRAEMDQRLLTRARAAGVEVLEEAQAKSLIVEGGQARGVRVRIGGEEESRRALITIDATGRLRALARRIDSGTSAPERAVNKRATLVAFKAHFENAQGGERACEIYFYRGGYGGLSVVENNRSNLCFIASARDVRARGGDAWRVLREVVMSNRRAAEALRGARLSSPWLSVALEQFGRRAPVPVRGLIAVGDAASFIDPFTGSGMLMALESGEVAAETILRHLPSLHQGDSFDALSRDYNALYDKRFGARLRVCAWLRRAAFAPPAVIEAAILTLGTSARARRMLARATRRDDSGGGREALSRS